MITIDAFNTVVCYPEDSTIDIGTGVKVHINGFQGFVKLSETLVQ